MKRTSAKPYLRSESELKLNCRRNYTQMVKSPSNIKPIWKQDNYGVKKGAEKNV
jgi:hypothetical protein